MGGFENHSEVELLALARTVGRRVARKWPGQDHEDLAQEALLRLYEKVDKLFDKETRYLYRVMERAAMSYASKERYDYMVNTSSYVYTPKEVRAILETVYFDPEAWDTPTQKDDSTKDWIEQGTIGVSLIDMKTAFEKISKVDRGVLEERYFFQQGQAGDNAEQKAVQRGVDNLTKFMNWGKEQDVAEGPVSRKTLSNATAQSITESYETGQSRWFEEDATDKLQREYADFGLRPGEGYDFNKYTK